MTKQERAARTRLALVRSAAMVFEKSGYTQARLSEISAGAGVSAGALHFHFENKAVMADAVEQAACRTLRLTASRVRRRDASALQKLVDLSHGFGQLLRTEVVVRAGLRLNADTERAPALDLRREWHACVDALLVEAGRTGGLSQDLPPHRAGSLIFATSVGLEVLAREDGEWVSPGSLAHVWRLLLPSVASPLAVGALDPAGSGTDFE